MIVSLANSIRFRPINELKANFDNTLVQNEDFINQLTYEYCQKFLITDTVVKIQVKADVGETPVFTYYRNDGTSNTVSGVLEESYTDFDILEYTIDMSLHASQKMYAIIEGDTDMYISEPWEVLLEDTNYLYQVEWFNNDTYAEMDWTTGITSLIRVEGVQKTLSMGGESSIYDNQGEKTKLKDIVTRIFEFKASEIPRYLAETLQIAAGCDAFYINEVEFVTEDKGDIEDLDATNLVELTLTVEQRNVVGLNTHDVGYDCDAITTNNEVAILKIISASGQESMALAGYEGYLIHTIVIYYVNGSNVVAKAGRTVGGNDLMYDAPLSPSVTPVMTSVHFDIPSPAGYIYFDIAGTSAIVNIYVQLIKNRDTI